MKPSPESAEAAEAAASAATAKGDAPVAAAAAITSHSARITAPVGYTAASGRRRHIPVGPCLVENLGRSLVDIVWGQHGQSSAALPLHDVESARHQGHLLLLD